jgi:hypothetical protein
MIVVLRVKTTSTMIVTSLFVSFVCLVVAQQTALTAPAGTLISSESLSVLSHPKFPSHKIRVKRNTLCEDEKVAAGYSGYLDIGSLPLNFTDPQTLTNLSSSGGSNLETILPKTMSSCGSTADRDVVP